MKTLTKDEYQFKIKQQVDALKARTRKNYYASFETTAEVRAYFTKRAMEIGEACFRIYDLQTPMLILVRVLCEDSIQLCWALQSDENATLFPKLSLSELTRNLRSNLRSGIATIRHTGSGADVTQAMLPALNEQIVKKKKIEVMAKETGLTPLYEIVYRYGSLAPHAATFDLDIVGEKSRDSIAPLSTIHGLLGLITLTLDEGKPPVGKELLDKLGLKVGKTDSAKQS